MTESIFPAPVRIATRSSELALWQARHVSDLILQLFPELSIELVDVTTQGDEDQTQPLRNFGGTGVFTKEVQKAVLDGRADLAVHSLKDLPTEILEPDLVLAAVPEREIRWDALVLPAGNQHPADQTKPFELLPEGSKIGSGSSRRQAQVRQIRPDLELVEIRGNLNTRFRKLDEGEYDALILASAGIIRLGWQERLSCPLMPPVMFPAVGQGALGLECRRDDLAIQKILEPLNHKESRCCTEAERAMLGTLRAGCHAPVGVYSRWEEERFELTGIVLSPDGKQKIEVTETLSLSLQEEWLVQLDQARQLGQKTAHKLIEQGAMSLIEH